MKPSLDQIQKMDRAYGPGWMYNAPPLATRFDKLGTLELRAVGADFGIPNNREIVRVKGFAGVIFVLQRYGCTFTEFRPDPDFGGRAKPLPVPPLGLYPTSWSIGIQPRSDGIASMNLTDNRNFTGFSDFEQKDIHKGAIPFLALCPEKAFLDITLHSNGALRFQAENDQWGVFAARLGGFFIEIPK